MAKSKRIEFDIPEGFVVPEGVSANGQFEALATIQLKEDGRACLVAVDGYRMPGYQEEDSDSDDEQSYSSAASAGMPESY